MTATAVAPWRATAAKVVETVSFCVALPLLAFALFVGCFAGGALSTVGCDVSAITTYAFVALPTVLGAALAGVLAWALDRRTRTQVASVAVVAGVAMGGAAIVWWVTSSAGGFGA